MAKRCNSDRNFNTVTNIHVSYSDSDPEDSFNTMKRRKLTRKSTRRAGGKSVTQIPTEENEHTYSSIPIFNNIDAVQGDNYSSDSDYEDTKRHSQRISISERSTSSESIKSISKTTKRTPKCFSKNAVMARMNRQKKKEYVEKLECDISSLKECNNDMKIKLDKDKEVIATLRKEIRYLRSALLNSKEIGLLLRRVCGDQSDSKVTSSLLRSPTPLPEMNLDNFTLQGDCNEMEWPVTPPFDALTEQTGDSPDVPTSGIAEVEPLEQYGICLHLSNNQVSFEFCESCNHRALNGDLDCIDSSW